MKTALKNYALITTLMFAPIKSTNTAQTTKHIKQNTSQISSLLKLVEQNNNKTYNFFNKKIIKYKEHEARKMLNIIKMPKPQKDLDVSKTKFVGHPEFLNMFLKGVLAGKGEQFIQAQEKHGVNASFLVGIANLESGNGLADYAIHRNNIAGMRNSEGYMYFKSVDDCIDRMAENLKRNYIDKGLTTISKINGKYAESEEWAKTVVARMNPMYEAAQCKIYDFEK